MKGITNIKIYNKDGKLKQEIKEENMITNNLKMLYEAQADMRVGGIMARKNSSYGYQALYGYNNPLILFSGIYLLSETIPENADNYAYYNKNLTEIGHGAGQEDTGSPKCITLNPSASGPLTNGYKWQWIAGENKAVGSIKSVCLCHYRGGYNGYADDYESVNNYMMIDLFANYNDNDNIYYRNIKTADSKTSYIPIGMYDKKIYSYIGYDTSTKAFSMYINDTGDLNIVNNLNNKLTDDGMDLVIGKQKTITLSDIITDITSYCIFKNYLFVYFCKNSKELYVNIYDLEADELYKSLSIVNTTDFYYGYGNAPFEIAPFIYQGTSGDIDAFATSSYGKNIYIYNLDGTLIKTYTPVVNDSTTSLKTSQYNDYTFIYKCMNGGYTQLGKTRKTDGYVDLGYGQYPHTRCQQDVEYKNIIWSFKDSYAATYDVTCFSTINNLSGTINKTATDTMIIDYTILYNS